MSPDDLFSKLVEICHEGTRIPAQKAPYYKTYDFSLRKDFPVILNAITHTVHTGPPVWIYRDGLYRPEVPRDVDDRVVDILRHSEAHRTDCSELYKRTNTLHDLLCENVLFFYSPSIYVLLVGCLHTLEWYKRHEDYIINIGKCAEVICIEGNADLPFGNSLDYFRKSEDEFYGRSMRDISNNRFSGVFAEIDMRDNSKIDLENFNEIPEEFFDRYFQYLSTYFPLDAARIKDRKALRLILERLSTTNKGLLNDIEYIAHDGVLRAPGPGKPEILNNSNG